MLWPVSLSHTHTGSPRDVDSLPCLRNTIPTQVTIVLFAKRSMRKCQEPKEMRTDVSVVGFCNKIMRVEYVRNMHCKSHAKIETCTAKQTEQSV